MNGLPAIRFKGSRKARVSDAKICCQEIDAAAIEKSHDNSLAEKENLSPHNTAQDFSQLKIGVMALQGAFAKHCEMISSLGATAVLVKKPKDLLDIDALIIPGGESTTMMHQIKFIDLFPAMHHFAKHKPIFGTCAGLILMSNSPSKLADDSLLAIDVSVERNAFGRQIESFKADIDVKLPHAKHFAFPAIFIRAPRIKSVGDEVLILATYEGEPVLVQQGMHLGSSFHPELTKDLRIHSYFLSQIKKMQ